MNFFRVFSVLRDELRQIQRTFTLRWQAGLLVAGMLLLGIGHLLEHELHGVAGREQLQLVLIAWDSIAWFVWLFAAPAILVLVRHFPLTRGEFRRHIPRLVVGSLLIYTVVINLRFVIRIVPNLWMPPAEDIPVNWSTYWAINLVSLPMDFLTYGGFFSACVAIDYYFKQLQRGDETLQLRLRTAQLESELAQAELSALRNQLHPHFLFNSFNAVSTLVRQQRNSAAVEVIAHLSSLLRFAMERTGKPELTLEDEMDFIRRYLAIERIRFGEKLQLEFDIDPATLTAAVPNLVLQPLVENAVKHGISRLTAPGKLRIGAHLVEGRLMIVIENDGPDPSLAPPPSREPSSGIGLVNTRSRLDKIYGPNYQLELIRRNEGGMRVRLNLPWNSATEL